MNSICFIITKSNIGGAQKWVKEQIDFLSKENYSCYIVSNKEGWLTQHSNTINNMLDLRIEKRVSISFVFKLINFIRKNKIKILVGNSANGGIYSRIAGIFTKAKVVYVSHGWSAIYNGGKNAFIFTKIEKMLSFLTYKILCISQNDFDIALKKIGIKKDKLFLLSNKILPFENSNKMKDHELSILNRLNVKLLFLGRLEHPKNPLALIKAIQNQNNFILDIVGDGKDYYKINNYISENNIYNVHLLGEKENFDDFDKYDIFCLISKSEGLPISAIEALSFGMPLLLSNVGGCFELIKENGYLTDNSEEDILKGLNIIKSNYNRFSKNSLKLFFEKYDLSKNFIEYINFYKTIN